MSSETYQAFVAVRGLVVRAMSDDFVLRVADAFKVDEFGDLFDLENADIDVGYCLDADHG